MLCKFAVRDSAEHISELSVIATGQDPVQIKIADIESDFSSSIELSRQLLVQLASFIHIVLETT